MAGSNVVPVCQGCVEERQRRTQLRLAKDSTSLVGKFAKITFREGKKVEHMWVKVSSDNGKTLSGTLDNDPVLVGNVAYGDPVEFKRAEIQEVMP